MVLKEIRAVSKFYVKKHLFSAKGITLLLIFLSLPIMVGIAYISTDNSGLQMLYIADYNSWKIILTFGMSVSLFLGQFGGLAAIVAGSYMFGEGYSDHKYLYEISYPVSRKQHYSGRIIASFIVSTIWTGIAYFTSIFYFYVLGDIKFSRFDVLEFLETIWIGTIFFIVIVITNIFYLGISALITTQAKQVTGPMIFLIGYIFFIDSLVDLGWPYLMNIIHKNWDKFLVLQYHLDRIRNDMIYYLLLNNKLNTLTIITIFGFAFIGILAFYYGMKAFEQQDL